MIKFIGYIVCYCIYPFSFLFPRSKKKWAFGSFRGAFNDNAKYMFIYASNHLRDRNCAWLSIKRSTVNLVRSKGMKAYHILSPSGIWFALTSKYWVYNAYTSDIMFCLSGNAVSVNLWHGLSMKRIEFNITSGALADRFVKKTLKERFYHPETFKRPDHVLSSSDYFTLSFAKSFRIPVDHCLEFGYPRNEILLWNEADRMAFVDRYEPVETKQLLERLKNDGYDKVYMYLPTWRDAQRNLFVKDFDLKRMDAVMKEHNALLLLKPHANTFVEAGIDKGLTNVTFIASTIDIYPILPCVDVLITDYSSVTFDFSLMKGKNLILYPYDYEEYKKGRDFDYPYDDLIVGKKVYDFDSLLAAMVSGQNYMPEENRLRFVEECWGGHQSGACEKIGSFLISLDN